MADLISRQAAIDALSCENPTETYIDYDDAVKAIRQLPSAEPDLGEWCTDCKEYDHEKHSCPRWNRVIRQTVEDLKAERRAESEITECPMCPDCPDGCPMEVERD